MITLDVAEYCSACMDFDPDVQRPQKAYGMSEEIVISDTIIRCSNRNRCKNIERYLRKKVTDDGAGKTGEAMPRRSGRYPWGSGDNPYQHSGDFLSRVEELKKSNF